MEKIVYPRLPEQLDRRRKLMTSDIVSIREEYQDGRTIQSLADEYGVTYGAIRYWIDSDYRDRLLQYSKKRNTSVPYCRESSLESYRYRTAVNPAFREWHRLSSKVTYIAKQWNKQHSQKSNV